ncbi:helix-turn-helix domain-containing protein [Halomonas sp. PR-M31]|uniref:helix-turn-helix domain-containing protein n=1 Tax=Halomonas sp. PR-M31 TaxID=1471202 RepID=UPI000651734B|nr:helix-turn-helix transcriptional regulator [Halomonas sp. PR-M31]
MSLLEQIKSHRLTLGLKQSDMLMRLGMSRQQYQRLEANGNPRLNTLELVAKGLNAELMLIPQGKREAVLAVLASGHVPDQASPEHETQEQTSDPLVDDPWEGLLGENE